MDACMYEIELPKLIIWPFWTELRPSEVITHKEHQTRRVILPSYCKWGAGRCWHNSIGYQYSSFLTPWVIRNALRNDFSWARSHAGNSFCALETTVSAATDASRKSDRYQQGLNLNQTLAILDRSPSQNPIINHSSPSLVSTFHCFLFTHTPVFHSQWTHGADSSTIRSDTRTGHEHRRDSDLGAPDHCTANADPLKRRRRSKGHTLETRAPFEATRTQLTKTAHALIQSKMFTGTQWSPSSRSIPISIPSAL